MPSSEALTIELGSENVQMYTFVSSIYRLEWKDDLFSASAYRDRAVMYGHSEQSTFFGFSKSLLRSTSLILRMAQYGLYLPSPTEDNILYT